MWQAFDRIRSWHTASVGVASCALTMVVECRASRKWNKISNKSFHYHTKHFRSANQRNRAVRNDESVNSEILKHESKTWCSAYRVCVWVCCVSSSIHFTLDRMLSFASNHERAFCILIKWSRQFRFCPVFFVSPTSSSMALHGTPAADHMFYSLAFILFRIWIFFLLAWNIFNFYGRDFQLWTQADGHSHSLRCPENWNTEAAAADGNIFDVFFLAFYS